jgi:inosose dehydratase
MSDSKFTRRDALKGAAVAALGLPWLRPASATAAEPAPRADRTRGVRLGIASYSLSSLTVEQVIPVVLQLEIKTVSLFHTHAPWSTGTPEECQAAVRKFADAGIAVTSTGVVDLPNDEAVVRKAFGNVRAAGLRKFCGRPALDAYPLVERCVREFDLRVAIHNHGPGDLYPSPYDAMKAARAYDPRIGLCIDVGHCWLGGVDPAAAIRDCHERLFEVHLKDSLRPAGGGKTSDTHPAVVGHGSMDIRGILGALIDVGYAGETEFEFEQKVKDRVPGLAESVGYVRGMLAAT